MRKPSETLYELVHTLTSREKAHFRKTSQAHSVNGSPEYLKLFDAIVAQKQYDETALKEKFKDEGFVKHFHKTKEFLYSNLLDSLQVFHRKGSVLTTLLNIPPKIELLYEKQLFDQCLIQAKRMRKLAEQLDMPEHIASAILWELRLTFLQPAKYLDKHKAMESLDTLDRIVEEKKSSNDYLRSHTELFSDYYCHGQITGEVDLMKMYEKVRSQKLFSEGSQPKGNSANLYYLNFLQVYNQQVQDWENALEVTTDLEQYYSERPKLVSGSPHAVLSYVTTLFNKLMFSIEIEKWDTAHEVLGSIDSVKTKNALVKSSNRLQGIIFTYYSIGGLLLFQRSGSWEAGVEFSDQVKKELEGSKWTIPANRLWEIEFRSLLLNYWAGDLKTARILANRLWQEAEKVIDDGMSCTVLLLRSLIYLESTNEEEAESVIRSTQRTLKKKNTYRSFVKFVNLLLKLVTAEEEKKRALLLVAQQKMMKLKSQDIESYAFAEFDMTNWIDQQLAQKESIASI